MKYLAAISMVIFAITSVASCATYKSSESGLSKMGYEEELLNDGSYQLVYYGSKFSDHDELVESWHKRAGELCSDRQYESKTKSEHWSSDSYTLLLPFFFKSKTSSPSVSGKLRCNNNK